MKNLNLYQCIGRLGRDPEVRYLPNGDAVASFSLAVQDDYKSKDGQMVERTEWIRFAAFGKSAEIIGQYAKKGDKLYASGKYTSRKYTDKTTGAEREAIEIRVENFELLSPKQEGAQPATRQAQRQPMPEPAPMLDDDIPF